MKHHIAWYPDEATYLRFKELCADNNKFGDSYAQWKSAAQKRIDIEKSRGVILTKVDIDADGFLAWCVENAYVREGAARAAFAGVTYSMKSGKVGNV